MIAAAVILASALTITCGTAPEGSADSISFPYYAKPTSDNVNIRSGGGTAYYSCGKLDPDEKVTVIGKEFGWAKILPPKDSFSWISKKYVKVDPSNPKVGYVTGDSVRVWVGSPLLGALTSSSTRTKLSQEDNDKVKLLGEEDDGYYKIAPPKGAHRYVRGDNLKYVGPVEEEKPEPKEVVEKPAEDEEPDLKENPVTIDKNTEKDETEKADSLKEKIRQPEKSVSKSPTEKKLIEECRKLYKLIDAERNKPLDQQNYEELKKAAKAIYNDPAAEKSKTYAKYLIDRANRFEMVIIAEQEVETDEKILDETRGEITDKLIEEKQQVKDPGKYVIRGTIEPSNVFNAAGGLKRYVIKNNYGKIISYAIPGEMVSEYRLQNMFGKRVALVGKVLPKSYSSVSLIKFTDIVDAASIDE